MSILVTGSAGHLGEALIRSLRACGECAVGLDMKESRFTDYVGSITDRSFVREVVSDCSTIVHAASLHKPHVGTHTRQHFVDTNVSGTLNLLEEAVATGCRSFIYTSTTSTFGDAMRPAAGGPAVWVTEELRCKPKNIYGVTKAAAEDLCDLFNRNSGLPCIVLKTSRFFPEEDDDRTQRESFDDANLKVNELPFRRVDIADIVTAHRLAISKASEIGFAKLIISATTPFLRGDAEELRINTPAVLARRVPEYVDVYERRGWKMFQTLDRVYDNTSARKSLGWEPEFTFEKAIKLLGEDSDYRSELSRQVGMKGYHSEEFEDGPYPVDRF